MRRFQEELKSSVKFVTLLVFIGCSTHQYEGATAGSDSTEKTGNEAIDEGGGSNDGDPIVYKINPKERDPKNKYTMYLRVPTKTWYVNKLVPKTLPITIGIDPNNPTSLSSVRVIERSVKSSSINPVFKQVAPPTISTLGPVAQSGRVAGHTAGKARTDQTFLANNRGMVDILIVMDNSGSMYQESQYIRNYLPELMKHIWRSDWRLGMTNSSGSKCNVTTLTAQQAGDKNNTIKYRLDRDSMIYSNFHTDLARQTRNKPTPWYLAPYFYHHTSYTGDRVLEKSDYRWLSPCAYNLYGSCGGSIVTDYRKDKSYNPLKYYFGAEGLNIFTTDASAPDSGDEKVLSKVRWVLEGKKGTTCEGWARDKATVVSIVITDEGHNCSAENHTYCSIDSYKAFANQYGSNRKFLTYGVLSSSKQPDHKYIPRWASDELGVFDGYTINYNEKFEGGSVLGYFKNLSNGYQRISPPAKIPSSNTSYHEKLASSYGHRSLHLISMSIADELRNIYSPLENVPDLGTAEVKVASYITDTQKRSSEYKYGAALDPCGAQGLGATDPCYVVHSDQKAFELVQHGNMSHFDKQIKITYNYGGTSTSAVPFDDSWTLAFAPDPASVRFSVTLKDGTTNVLTRGSDYSINGAVVSVPSNQVQYLVPEGSSVTITYAPPIALQRRFTLKHQDQIPAGDLVSNTAEIVVTYADGNSSKPLTSGFSFDGTTVTFSANNVPPAGSQFTLSYDYYDAFKISYDYTRADKDKTDSSVALQCTNISRNGAAVSCSHTGDTITFTNTSQFGNGDSIRIVEKLLKGSATIRDYILPDSYAEHKDVSASAAGYSCSSGHGTLEISGNVIKFSTMAADNCGIIAAVNSNPKQQVSLTYYVYEDLPNDFLTLDSSFFAKHRGKYKFEWWDVSVGTQSTTDFLIEDYKITEINEVMTDDEDGLREKFGDNTKIQVVLRLYHAL